jgi:hypothetical protein
LSVKFDVKLDLDTPDKVVRQAVVKIDVGNLEEFELVVTEAGKELGVTRELGRTKVKVGYLAKLFKAKG